MHILDIIEHKRDRLRLDDEEIAFFIRGVADKTLPDYQISALLMAMYLNGMDDDETAYMTREMANTGEIVDLSFAGGTVVDKHSSGGVGDKTTLVVAPMAAACGLKIAKMSGRGLGFSGGTLDKLESIPGFRVSLEREEFIRFVRRDGLAVIGQTADIAPADKILYALRDVTGTVASIPLIASSIMSKKLAVLSDAVVLDVKAGSGAFMKTPEAAAELAVKMVSIGKLNGRKTLAAVTNMDEPLGRAVGNALEVAEAVDTLRGNGPVDFTRLCYTIASLMLVAGNMTADMQKAEEMLRRSVENGSAFEKFRRMVINQGGDVSVTDDTALLPQARIIIPVTADRQGFVASILTEDIGKAAVAAGAGRRTKDDSIDYTAGIVIRKKAGDPVRPGETLCFIHADHAEKAEAALSLVKPAYMITDKAPDSRPPAVYSIIDEKGVHPCV